MAQPSPCRGEVWIIDTGWQGKTRPCLIVSIVALNEDRDLVTFVLRTTSLRGSRFEVPIDAPFFQKPGAFDVQGIATISRTKLEKKLGSLTPQQLSSIEQALRNWLGLN
jgi:mRNA interferase MazF